MDEPEMVHCTTKRTSARATPSDTRKRAKERGIWDTAVRGEWRADGLLSHVGETFNVSRHPNFDETLEDFVRVCVEPPESTSETRCNGWGQAQARKAVA